jgi:hypothetical protein
VPQGIIAVTASRVIQNDEMILAGDLEPRVLVGAKFFGFVQPGFGTDGLVVESTGGLRGFSVMGRAEDKEAQEPSRQ